jgi:superfamily I DNA/RNA helicase
MQQRPKQAGQTTIGIDPAFTILDREGAADLMNLVRTELGLSSTHKRFPSKATCLSIYSRAINSEIPLDELLADVFPWCQCWSDQLKSLFAGYVEAKQDQGVLDYDDLLLYWAQAMTVAEIAADIGTDVLYDLTEPRPLSRDQVADSGRKPALAISGLRLAQYRRSQARSRCPARCAGITAFSAAR